MVCDLPCVESKLPSIANAINPATNIKPIKNVIHPPLASPHVLTGLNSGLTGEYLCGQPTPLRKSGRGGGEAVDVTSPCGRLFGI